MVLFASLTVLFGVCFLPLLTLQVTGFTAVLVIPITIGVFCGLLAPSGRWLLLVLGVVAGFSALLVALYVGHVVGLFCGFVFAVVGLPPAMAAGMCVLMMRRLAGRRAASRPRSRSLLLLLAAPYASFAIESAVPFEPGLETLQVRRTIDAPIARVWRQSLGFDEAGGSSWQHVDAPLPRRASGRSSCVGDRKRVDFGKGHVLVCIAAIEPERRLVAEVLEQTIEANAVRLRRIVIACEPDGDAVHASFTIEFEPCMRPRWYLRLFEPWFGAVAMEPVMDAWQQGAERHPSAVRR